ncbi:sterol desaturase family protein [Bermanella marisrubri]|uniref:Fatty acid hydroxylase domain-containing protein n=1 Tax=Bermanella marisrubri TaxID=207949 RepID=Q1MZE4_9GAMM|nr:sterol desaturase family protein [Bermanella marisrubri]EAT11322.1 hypothetical protein RED65_12882 [Oceanobacter sp. RED65] [Bermanella marisrubri]QIZ85290.1 sterol desaturase family protein [Bermanella marisrubri]
MQDWIIQYEPQVRMSVFFGLLSFLFLVQQCFPRRPLSGSKLYRWGNNLGLVFFNSFVMRVFIPTTTVAVALWVEQKQWGIFNVWQPNFALQVILSLLLLDCLIYWQHRLFHSVPVLWRLHRVHHMDQNIDVTTGSRFHPIEIALSLFIKFIAVLLFGVDAVAIILFEVILNGTAMFNHANLRLPLTFDKWLRLLIVTPDMHRVHHSQRPEETDSNFGFNLSIWDRVFRSYVDQPRFGHEKMRIGLREFTDAKVTQSFIGMLVSPFQTSRHSVKKKAS